MTETFPIQGIRMPITQGVYVKCATERIEEIEKKRERMSFYYRCAASSLMALALMSVILDATNQNLLFVTPTTIFASIATGIAIINGCFDYFLHWRKKLINGRSPYLLNILNEVRDLEAELEAFGRRAVEGRNIDQRYISERRDRIDSLMLDLTFSNSMKRVQANYQPI